MDKGQVNSDVDINNLITSGYYRIYGSAINLPTDDGTLDYSIISVEVCMGYIRQTITNVNKTIPTTYIRTRDSSGTWRNWVKLS